MWIARDKDGGLFFYKHKPVRVGEVWNPEPVAFDDYQELDHNMDEGFFADVKWEDEEPTEIKLIKKE